MNQAADIILIGANWWGHEQTCNFMNICLIILMCKYTYYFLYQGYDHQTVEWLKVIDRLRITAWTYENSLILVLEVYFHDWTIIAHAHVHFAKKEK